MTELAILILVVYVAGQQWYITRLHKYVELIAEAHDSNLVQLLTKLEKHELAIGISLDGVSKLLQEEQQQEEEGETL